MGSGGVQMRDIIHAIKVLILGLALTVFSGCSEKSKPPVPPLVGKVPELAVASLESKYIDKDGVLNLEIVCRGAAADVEVFILKGGTGTADKHKFQMKADERRTFKLSVPGVKKIEDISSIQVFARTIKSVGQIGQ
jgi:hypothetical protein